MSLHSTPRPLMGSKVTAIKLPSPLVIPPPVVVVESPQVHKARFVGIESAGGGGAPAVFEGNPCLLRVVNESPAVGASLNCRLMLRGSDGFPAGIEIARIIGLGNSLDKNFALLLRGLCIEPGERIEIEILADNGDGDPTTATLVKVLASFCDFAREIVRTKRTKLVENTFVEIVPAPPTGGQNSLISRSDGTCEYSFFAAQNGSASTPVSTRLDDNGVIVLLGFTDVPNPLSAPFKDGTAPTGPSAGAVGITLEEGMKVQSFAGEGGDVVVLTTWMEISAPST